MALAVLTIVVVACGIVLTAVVTYVLGDCVWIAMG